MKEIATTLTFALIKLLAFAPLFNAVICALNVVFRTRHRREQRARGRRERFSIIGSLNAAAYALGTPPAWPMSEAPIESRQLIGWWRDAISDAITSSSYTGEHAIHSSDFSAFTKRSHCPSLLRFSGPNLYSAIIHLHFGDCLSGTLFSLRGSAMEYRRCQPPCARFIAREDPQQ